MLRFSMLLNFFDIVFYIILIIFNVLWVISLDEKEDRRSNDQNDSKYYLNLLFSGISINILNSRFSSSILISLNLIYLIFFTYLWSNGMNFNLMLWIRPLYGSLTLHLITIFIFSIIFVIYLNNNRIFRAYKDFFKFSEVKKIVSLLFGQALTFSVAILYRYRFLEEKMANNQIYNNINFFSFISSSISLSSFSSFSPFFEYLINTDFSPTSLSLSIIIIVFSWAFFFNLLIFSSFFLYQDLKKEECLIKIEFERREIRTKTNKEGQ